jgi:hypothetical protein
MAKHIAISYVPVPGVAASKMPEDTRSVRKSAARSWSSRPRRYVLIALLAILAFFVPLNVYAQSFVYTNNDVPEGNTITGFVVGANGSLAGIPGSPFATGGLGVGGGFFAANRIGTCVVGNLLYASNGGSGDVSGFSINPSTGVLTAIPGSPFPVAGGSTFNGISLGCMPDGQFLIAAHGDANLITVFSIASNGALTPIAGSPFSTTSSPDGIKISPNNKLLAVAEPGINAVEVFSIGSDGSLTSVPGSPFPGRIIEDDPGAAIAGVDIDCASNRLFAGRASSFNAVVDVFSIAPSGALTPIAGSPFIGGSPNSNVVVLSPDDRLLFVSTQNPFGSDGPSSTIISFAVGTDGSLSEVAFVDFGNFPQPSGMATDRAGDFLYAADPRDVVHGFSITSDGALTPVPGSPFPTGEQGALLSLTVFPAKACVTPSRTVAIDIRPGDSKNPVNPKSGGVIQVAILSSDAFDATAIDPGSLRFGPDGAHTDGKVRTRDVNKDGRPDLLLHFRTQDSGIECGDASASLTGRTVNGEPVQGSDTITTVGCKKEKKAKAR